MANIKISELIVKDSPSTSATLVGVDNGETVQIPITEFAESEHEHSEYAKTSDIPSLDGYAKTTDIPSLDGYAKTSDIPSLDGYAKTSDLFSKNYNDLTNKPTIPSIAGLATTAYVDQKVSSMSGGSSSGGTTSNSSIITVDTLPAEGINSDAIYVVTQNELASVKMFMGDTDMTSNGHVVEVVDELPSNPKVCTDANNSYTHTYWLTTDDSCSGYIDDEFASMIGVPSGWYSFETLITQFGFTFGGVIESLDQVTDYEAFYLLKTTVDKKNLYQYKNGAFAKITSFPTTSDIMATPNPCIYKVYEIDELKMVQFDDSETPTPYINERAYIEIVNEIPENPQPFMNLEAYEVYGYYNRTVGKGYGYITEEISLVTGMPAGLLCIDDMFSMEYINSLDEATDPEKEYFVQIKKPHLYFYDGDDWLEISTGFRMVHNPRLETITFIES